jgi:tight adherence protein C
MSPQIAIFLVIVFASVAIAIGAAATLAFRWNAPEHREIRKLASQRNLDGVFTNTELTEAVAPWVKRFKQVAPKSPKEMSKVRRRLATAGYRSMTAAILYSAAEVILPVVFGAGVLLVVGFSKWYIGIFGAAIGWMLPSFWLGRQTTLRQKQIRNGLPDALDLMIVCIEAGSGIDQALVKTSDELDISYPALAEELRLVTTEIRAGKPRLEAFKNFASRTKVDEVRSLVAMLVQTDRFGTSVAQALRTHAEVSRTKRRQNAEERAAKIGVKLVFPLVFCLFPSLYVAILGPAVVDHVRVFKPEIVNKGSNK